MYTASHIYNNQWLSQYRFGLNFWNFFDLVHLNSEYLDKFPDFFSMDHVSLYRAKKVTVVEFTAVGLTPDKRCGKPQQPSFPFFPFLFLSSSGQAQVFS